MLELVKVEGIAVIEGLVVQPHMRAGVEIDMHAPLLHGAIGLRGPGTAGLAVTGRRHVEDAFHIVQARFFPAVELGDTVIPAQVGQIHRRRRLHTVPTGMEADFVFFEGLDDVGPPAALEAQGAFADDLEHRPDQLTRQKARQAQGGIVAGRQEIVLGIEP